VDDAKPLRRFGIALLGGFRAAGPLRIGDRLVRVSLIGGVDLDLTEAEFTAPRFTIVKVSLIGGVDVRLPASGAAEIVVQSYGLLGGVKIHRPGS
jgi:hypothetical protein